MRNCRSIFVYILYIIIYIYTHHIICIYSYSSRSLWMCHILRCFSAIQLLWIGWREMTLKTADVVGVRWILDEEKIPQSMVDASQEAEALKTSKNQDQRVETSKMEWKCQFLPGPELCVSVYPLRCSLYWHQSPKLKTVGSPAKGAFLKANS